jgi:hypothetical protein
MPGYHVRSESGLEDGADGQTWLNRSLASEKLFPSMRVIDVEKNATWTNRERNSEMVFWLDKKGGPKTTTLV